MELHLVVVYLHKHLSSPPPAGPGTSQDPVPMGTRVSRCRSRSPVSCRTTSAWSRTSTLPDRTGLHGVCPRRRTHTSAGDAVTHPLFPSSGWRLQFAAAAVGARWASLVLDLHRRTGRKWAPPVAGVQWAEPDPSSSPLQVPQRPPSPFCLRLWLSSFSVSDVR